MRRLPVYFVLDVSYSMAGASYEQLQEALASIVATLRRDPYALETAYLCVIAFAGKPKTITPLVELIAFRPSELALGSGTSLGAALEHLMNEIDRDVVKTTPEIKGDWRPVVFLLTDGHPTDSTAAATRRWNTSFRNRANLVAVSLGGQADQAVLRALTEDVVVFNEAAPDAFARFAKWVSMSIQTQSRSVSAGNDDRVSLAKGDPELLVPAGTELPVHPGNPASERFAFFVGRCEKTRLAYLVKYERTGAHYSLDLAVPLDEGFLELSDSDAAGPGLGNAQFVDWPVCPRCGAAHAMAYCACASIHCVDGPGVHTCPWCGKTNTYEFGSIENLGGGRG